AGESVCVMPVLVLKMNRIGKSIARKFMHRYYSSITVGYSLFLPDLYSKLSEEKAPLFSAYGFDGALIWDESGFSPELLRENQSVRVLHRSGQEEREILLTSDLLDRSESVLSRLSRHHTVKIGDIFLLPLWSEYEKANLGDNLYLSMKGTESEGESVLLTKLSLR
ncbi:MAG: hypothetical protein Q3998_07010, partial [Porphyromonas sp.]|nr:hypothetical protein [Porphyromonas sp.]